MNNKHTNLGYVMKIGSGIVEDYNSQKGFGFVSNFLHKSFDQNIFLHISVIKNTQPRLLSYFENNAPYGLHLWYLYKEEEKGKAIKSILTSSIIHKQHDSEVHNLINIIEDIWSDKELFFIDDDDNLQRYVCQVDFDTWLYQASQDLIGLEKTDKLKQKREASIMQEKEKKKQHFTDVQDSIENHNYSISNVTDMQMDEPRTSVSMDEFSQLVEDVYNLDLTYECLVYDVTIYKQMANLSFNVMLPLRKTNKVKIEQMLAVDSVIHVSWQDYQVLITSSHDRYNSMVNLFNVLQYKFERPLIRIKNPLDPMKDMPSARQLKLMYETDKNSTDYKEFIDLLDYYDKNKS